MRKLLETKKAYYMTLKENIKVEDFTAQIEKELAMYKEQLLKTVETNKAEKISKIDAYLEMIDELLDSDEIKYEELDEQADNQLENNNEINEEV